LRKRVARGSRRRHAGRNGKLAPTLAEVERLAAAGESETLELKQTTGELREAMETLCGFLNHAGGKVLFGVTPGGKIIGQQVTGSTLHDVTTAVRKIDPAPQVDVTRVNVEADRDVIVLHVTAGAQGPYTYDGRPFVRVGNTTRQLRREEYERLVLARLNSHHRWEPFQPRA